MALLKFAAEILGMRGTSTGLIFSANKAGPYCKAFASPTNTNTAPQQTRRSALALISETWRTLTQSQRDDWDDFADSPPETDYDPWGTVVYLTGHQWFARINLRRFSAAQTALEDPPTSTPQTPVNLLLLTAYDYSHTNTQSFIIYATDAFDDGSYAVVHLNLLYSQGLKLPTTNFLLAHCAIPDTASKIYLGTYLNTLFGQYPADTLLYAKLARQSTTGIRSTPTTNSTIVLT